MDRWLDIPRPWLMLAPMAGITDWPFRQLCYDLGVDVAVVPFVAAHALARKPQRLLPRLGLDHGLHPFWVQLYGKRSEDFRRAAQVLRDHSPTSGIDINMGCPAPQVVRSQHGSALLRDPQLAAEIVSETAAATELPVTVKMRLGWGCNQAPDLARLFEDAGAAAIVLHGRTREQMFAGEVDVQAIRDTKAAISVPLIANGDILSVSGARLMLAETGADGVMVGRGAMADPSLFAALRSEIKNDSARVTPSIDRAALMRRQTELTFAFQSDHAALTLRKHLIARMRGHPSAAQFRKLTATLNSRADVDEFINQVEATDAYPQAAADQAAS